MRSYLPRELTGLIVNWHPRARTVSWSERPSTTVPDNRKDGRMFQEPNILGQADTEMEWKQEKRKKNCGRNRKPLDQAEARGRRVCASPDHPPSMHGVDQLLLLLDLGYDGTAWPAQAKSLTATPSSWLDFPLGTSSPLGYRFLCCVLLRTLTLHARPAAIYEIFAIFRDYTIKGPLLV